MSTIPQPSPRRQDTAKRFAALPEHLQLNILRTMFAMLGAPPTPRPVPPACDPDQERIDATCRDLLGDILPNL